MSALCVECLSPSPPKKAKARLYKFCSSLCRHRHWRKNNRQKIRDAQKRNRAKRYKKDKRWVDSGPKAVALKLWMIELKSKPCTDCGGKFPVCCMDFDHIPGSTKSYDIGSMFAHHYSRQLIEKELLKCELVCANCHRIRTRDRKLGGGKYGICGV